MKPEFKTWKYQELHMTTVAVLHQKMTSVDFGEFLDMLTQVYQTQLPNGVVYDLTKASIFSFSILQIQRLVDHLQAIQTESTEFYNKVVVVVVGNRFIRKTAAKLVKRYCSAKQLEKIRFCSASNNVVAALKITGG